METFMKRVIGLIGILLAAAPAFAQLTMVHDHGMMVNGVPGGLPAFCESPTVTSVASGAWSSPATWSSKKVPGANDKVLIAAGHAIAYDAVSDAKLTCIE